MPESNCCSHDLKLLEFSFLNALTMSVSCFLQLLILFVFNFLLPKAWQIGKLEVCKNLHHDTFRTTESPLACTTASHPWFPTSKRLIYLQSLEWWHLWNSINSPAVWNESGIQQCLKWVGFVPSVCSSFLLEQWLMRLLLPGAESSWFLDVFGFAYQQRVLMSHCSKWGSFLLHNDKCGLRFLCKIVVTHFILWLLLRADFTSWGGVAFLIRFFFLIVWILCKVAIGA